jgi:hypothetical protein
MVEIVVSEMIEIVDFEMTFVAASEMIGMVVYTPSSMNLVNQ